MDEDTRVRILKAATELFNAKGYRNATLSDLAAHHGMSKKTLYLYFSGKEEIAEAVLDRMMSTIAKKVTEAALCEENPLQLLEQTFMGITQELMNLGPLFLEDVQKYIPGLWRKVEAFRARQLTLIEDLLKKALQAGSIREVNLRLLTVIMIESIQQFVRPDFAAKHGFAMIDIANTLHSLFIEGVRAHPEPQTKGI